MKLFVITTKSCFMKFPKLIIRTILLGVDGIYINFISIFISLWESNFEYISSFTLYIYNVPILFYCISRLRS